jgi:hypothetical protein
MSDICDDQLIPHECVDPTSWGIGCRIILIFLNVIGLD